MGLQNNIQTNGTDVYTQVIVPIGLQKIVSDEIKRLDKKKETLKDQRNVGVMKGGK